MVVLALDAARPTSYITDRIPMIIVTRMMPVTVAKTYFRNSFIIVYSLIIYCNTLIIFCKDTK